MKKRMISCLCGVFAFSLIGGMAVLNNNISVSAQETEVSAAFVMDNGAAVCKDGGGLRFSANLDINTYNAIKEKENVKFGMIIVPADSVYVDATTLEYADSSVYAKTGYELTVENIWGTNPKFSTQPTASQRQIIDEAATLENNNIEVGQDAVTLYGSIENFNKQNYVRSFVGRAYYYTEESGYVFADYYDDTTNDKEAPIENNTRCMYYVAQLAIENGDNLAASVQTTYIDGFEQYLADNNKSGRYRYFVDTYVDDVLTSTESAYAKINSSVSVTPEDKDGYAVNQMSSKLAGTVYAAGKQRLVIRYESAPEAVIETATEQELAEINKEEIKIYGTTEEITLETAYTFAVTETVEEAEASAYANWIADYYVTVDRAIGANQLGLAGSYANWDNGNWVAFYAPATEANVATPLLGSVGGEWTYAELVKEVQSFDCGAFDANNVLGGMTMTVELRLTNPYDETDYIVVNKTEHTFAVPPEAEIKIYGTTELAELNDAEEIKLYNSANDEEVELETAYTFSTLDNATEAEENAYAKWNADYVVSFDKAVAANTVGLAGSYDSWDNGAWIAFLIDKDLQAGESVQLLSNAGVTVNYTELCTNVVAFDCGAFNFADENIGTTMTVELRLFNPYDATDYIVINKHDLYV